MVFGIVRAQNINSTMKRVQFAEESYEKNVHTIVGPPTKRSNGRFLKNGHNQRSTRAGNNDEFATFGYNFSKVKRKAIYVKRIKTSTNQSGCEH